MIYVFLITALLCPIIGLYVAGEKNRSGAEGAALGCLLGPVGVLIEACLPTRTKPTRRQIEADDRIRELNERPLVYDENRIDEDDVDRFING